MLKVVVVEDEELVRKGIVLTVDVPENGETRLADVYALGA